MDGWNGIQENHIMTDYLANTTSSLDPNYRAYVPDQAANLHSREYQTAVSGILVPDTAANGAQWNIIGASAPVHDYAAVEANGLGEFFFEMIHHTPEVIELGNILATVIREIEVYSSFRRTVKQLTSATENAGPGVSFVGLPGLPVPLPTQTGIVFDVQVTTVGPPSIDGTLDFVTNVVNFSIVITGDRVVMFPYAPERHITETLEFQTDIVQATDGGEQRISNRKNPRQLFRMMLRVPEGQELRNMMTLLKGWHPGVFGMPIWWEARELGANAATDDVTITVDTAYGDFRAGSLAIIWYNEEEFDALQIDSLTATSITFTSGLTQNFTAGETLVMPLRATYISATIQAQRYIKNLMDVRLDVQVIDNDVGSIADTSAFSEHNSKVLLDDPNMVQGQNVQDHLVRSMIRIDNNISPPIQLSTWLASHPVTVKGFFADSMQEVWQVRQLVHALRGSQIAFYLPTFYEDIVVVNDLASASVLMDIESIGYVDHIQAKEPFKSLWIELNDGTILTREVEAYDTISDTVERLTVDTVWPSLISTSDILRVSFCRLVRIANDEVKFNHSLPGSTRITAEVIGVGTP